MRSKFFVYIPSEMAEVPAKRRKLAHRELELLDLDDDALIEIIDKLDHKSKMQLMLTCKRFEGLIGNTFQFFKDFKLSLNERIMPIEPHYCRIFNFRRKFGFVVLTGKLKNMFRSQVLEILKNIGESVIEIEMRDFGQMADDVGFAEFHVSESDFLKLMRFMPNLRELSTRKWVKSDGLSVQPADVDFQLKRLNSLTCLGRTDLGSLTALIPSSLANLEIFSVEGSSVSEILARQRNLVHLDMINLKSIDLHYHPSNCHIKKLEIQDLVFPVKTGFQKFSDFMKIQKSVEDLNFNISEVELKNNNDYTEILTHLLNVVTLKKLQIHCGNMIFTPASKINVYNPTVETLDIMIANPTETDLQKLPHFFPNVTNLEFTWFYDSEEHYDFPIDLTPINSMKKLRNFKTDYMSEEMLTRLELKQMQEFRMSLFGVISYPDYSDILEDSLDEALLNDNLETRSASWKNFVNNNCQLEVLDLSSTCIPMELLQIALESLPLLKSLRVRVDGCNYSSAQNDPEHSIDFEEYKEIYVKEQAKKTANLIGDNYNRFEDLVLKLEDDGERVVDHLKKYYPKVRVENRTYDEIQRDRSLRASKKPLKLVILVCSSLR
jgi:hypothetical protein